MECIRLRQLILVLFLMALLLELISLVLQSVRLNTYSSDSDHFYANFAGNVTGDAKLMSVTFHTHSVGTSQIKFDSADFVFKKPNAKRLDLSYLLCMHA